MKAILRFHRQAPRKVRLVADAIRGRRVDEARVLLGALDKRAAAPMRKLLDSATANARANSGVGDTSSLYVKEVRVDKGVLLKRYMPRAFGRATPINKYTSIITLVLAERNRRDMQSPDDIQQEKLAEPSRR